MIFCAVSRHNSDFGFRRFRKGLHRKYVFWVDIERHSQPQEQDRRDSHSGDGSGARVAQDYQPRKTVVVVVVDDGERNPIVVCPVMATDIWYIIHVVLDQRICENYLK